MHLWPFGDPLPSLAALTGYGRRAAGVCNLFLLWRCTSSTDGGAVVKACRSLAFPPVLLPDGRRRRTLSGGRVTDAIGL